MEFGLGFWVDELASRGWPVAQQSLDVGVLGGQGIWASGFSPLTVKQLYRDERVEVAFVEVERGSLKRRTCGEVARRWKKGRLLRPFLVFSDGVDSIAAVVRGVGVGGEVRLLSLSGEQFHTDVEVLDSTRYVAGLDQLAVRYDSEFFPYERVQEEFFEKYSGLYERIEAAVKPVLKGENSAYAQRWLGRLMFLYFLQRKGWLKGDKRFIDSVEDYRALNRVFYDFLAKETDSGLPFLNGSLFEKEDYIDASEAKLARAMDPLYKEARSFFDNYNFTVDESAPMDVDVSIDPALIGTIFERMLPESRRSTTGTFYTPKNEVSFICRRALAEWLGYEDRVVSGADGKEVFEDGLVRLVRELGEKPDEARVRGFKDRLMTARVLDPAVGSGGFLLGMMQEMVELIHGLEGTVGWRTDPEELKNRILRNLYGFDIEPEAAEIARLRLWLSLIINQKTPVPLPNLDMNLIEIDDSLSVQRQQQASFTDDSPLEFRKEIQRIREGYFNEHDAREKKRLRALLGEKLREFRERTRVDANVIEFWLAGKRADIVVMNPPFVRQESIPEKKKADYVSNYNLDKKSDLYAYFVLRAKKLLAEGGVASIICSDKWLETGYGVSLQKELKPYLLAVYGQRERSFGADVNTVVSVISSIPQRDRNIAFTYVAQYGSERLRRSVAIDRKLLQPGKWFYLRAPRVFVENILPKLTHRLCDFTEIKRGSTTGANDFFYMKDITHLYEADRLSNPLKIREWGVTAITNTQLKEQGLIYIENEGGERYVINRNDLTASIRSPKQLGKYIIDPPDTLCLYTEEPGEFTQKYNKVGEKKGVQNRPTTKTRKKWWKLNELKPSRIILPKSLMSILYIPFVETPMICDNRFYTLNSKKDEIVWLYLNSTVFLLTIELFCRRLGGGASDIMADDYEMMLSPPNLINLDIKFDMSRFKREVKPYYKEIKENDRRELDIEILEKLQIKNPEKFVEKLYADFIEIVEDRIVKADHSRTTIKMEESE